MPYSRSTARNTFQSRANELRSSFRYAKVRPFAMPGDIRTLIFHASVFHLSAFFEDYLLQSLSGWMFELQSRSATSDRLPSRLRNLLFIRNNEGTLRKFVISGSEKELLDRMDGPRNGLSWLDDGSAIPLHAFYESLIKEKKFPTPENIDVLFGRFGLKNVIAEVSKRTKSDVSLKLRSFLDVRNAIAHEFPPGITEEDLEDFFASLSKWVGVIDRLLFSHVVRCSGAECWQR